METSRPAFSFKKEPLISYGLPFPEACRKHVEETFKASRVYIIASASLSKQTDALKDLQKALDGKVAGVRIGMKSHTFLSEVVDVTLDAQKVDADLIVTLGGGSLSDAAKLVAFALGNDIRNAENMMKLPHVSNPHVKANQPKCPIICIPTSLSGGEYSDYAGVTRDSDHQKFQFSSPLKGPKLVILDPELALTTPINVWLQSGVRSIDHCIEAFCHPKADELSAEACRDGLRCLVPGLLNTASNKSDVKARLDCQLGVCFAMAPLVIRPYGSGGASHGIGHMLGPLGVGHGETSCILLPAVCKWNAKNNANVGRQNLARELLWSIKEASERFEASGLKRDTADLGDLIDVIVRQLGLPRTLSEVKVGRDKFKQLAVNSLEDACCQMNPLPLTKEEQVLEILEMCA